MTKPRARLLLALLALPTLWLAWLQSRRFVDVENLAMKSVGTPEAAAMQSRLAEFGAEHTVLLCYEPISKASEIGETDEPAGLVAALRRLEGVTSVKRVPHTGEQAFLYAVDVAANESGSYANQVRGVLALAARMTPALLRLQATGQPVAEIAIAEAVAKERRTMIPLIAGVLGILLLLVYRRISLVVAVLAPTLAGVVWTGGGLALLGIKLDPVSALQDPVLLTVGVASAVHLIEAFLRHRANGASPAAAALRGAKELIAPTLLTAGTTVVGFASLLLASIPAVQQFGAFTAAGVVISCVLTFLIGPLLLILFAGSPDLATLRPPAGPSLDLARSTAVWVRGHRVAILAGSALLTTLGALSWTRLRIDTDPVSVLPARHAFRSATNAVAQRLGGIETFDLLLPAGPTMPGVLALTALQAKIAMEPGVALLAGPAKAARSGSKLLRVLLRPAGTSMREALFTRCETVARNLGFSGAVATGPSVQIARDSGRLARGQWAGMALTAFLLWLAMAIGFRSAWLGFLGLFPNLLPSVAIYGCLAAVGRPLSVASAMIGSIMLGLTVDNTIHLVHRFVGNRKHRGSTVAAVARALHDSGRGVLNGSIVLALGFGAGIVGQLETTREFGILAALAILVALVADLLLMPALLLLAHRTTGHLATSGAATHAALAS